MINLLFYVYNFGELMIKLLKFLKGKDLWLTFISFILTILQVVADVVQPFLLFQVLNPNVTLVRVLELGGIMLAAAIFGFICGTISTYTTARVGVRLGSHIRVSAFKHIQSLTFKEIDHFTTPSLITRITNDIMFFQNTLILSLRIVLRSSLLFFGGLVAIFVLGNQINLYWIGFIFLAIVVVLITIISIIFYVAIPYFRKQQKLMDKTNGVMRENLLGVRVVKAFNLQKEQIEKFDAQNSKLTKTSTIAGRWIVSIIPIIFFLVQISTVLIIISIGASKDSVNLHSSAIIASIIQISSLVVLGLILMVTVLINIAYTKASCDRINAIFASKPSIERNQSDNMIETSHVKFNDVSFKYFANEETEYALRNISFEAKPGEMIGIIGPTGSGKTTLVNLITRMYDVTKGQVLISNKDVREINYDSLRNSIGVSPQKSLLFSGTIATNLKYGKEDASEEEMTEACEFAQAMEFINSKDGRFDAIVEQRGTNLSGGQKQRISIARALIKKPKILILDDSTSALDMITEAKVQQAIRKYKNTTIFLIGQRISAISKADKIIVLEKGKMVGYGNHNNLMKNCELYKEIAMSQGGVK